MVKHIVCFKIKEECKGRIEEAKETLLGDYMYFACMLVKEGYADGVVSGALINLIQGFSY